MMRTHGATGVLAILAIPLALCCAAGQPVQIELQNPSFEAGNSSAGLPVGWRLYDGSGQNQSIKLEEDPDTGETAVRLSDGDPAKEIGLYQDVAIQAGETYRAGVMVRGIRGASAAGAYLQLRFSPSGHFAQRSLSPDRAGGYTQVSVVATAPGGDKTARIYLYTHKAPTPQVMVDTVTLEAGVPAAAPSPAPAPDPTPPVYTELRDLHLETSLTRDGVPTVCIVAPASGRYDQVARDIQAAIKRLSGVEVPIVGDLSPQASLPLEGNLIALGNRSTNALLSGLYDHFYTLIDLKYPGPGGHVVRSVHNPYGNGHNAIVVGGSDDAGVAAAAEALCDELQAAPDAQGNLSVGWVMDIALAEGTRVPTELGEFEIWDASKGYGSSGYFGWNSISKRMAMYCMTGDEFHAREVVRLSFPDQEALAEIDQYDQEMIEGKNDPLAGPYHYSAHYMILFWDLIEESPAFSDEERLKITNAFSRQLNHRVPEGIYRRTSPASSVGNRHGDWAAVSLYCLGRYFNKYYPGPIWQHCLDTVHLYYTALENHAWIAGSNDHLFWYNTYYEPIESYMLLSGDRRGLESGYLQEALRTQDVLYTGRIPDPYLRTAPISWLNKTAYLTGQERWLYYRDRTELDMEVFRLGQSFWPGPELTPRPPQDLVNQWTIQRMPEPMWRSRQSGIALDNSFLWGSYRSAVDGTGDFILLDGFNGGGRNPYHTFGLLELRLNGAVLLQNYHNQVLTSADGMVEPIVAMDAALLGRDVVGQTAVVIAEVPRLPFCTWRRAIVSRRGRYALFVDDLAFRTTSENMDVVTQWEPAGGAWDPKRSALEIRGAGPAGAPLPEGWQDFPALQAPYTSEPPGQEGVSELDSINILLLKAQRPGHWVEMTFSLEEAMTGHVYAYLLNYMDRGNVNLYLDGELRVEGFDHYAPSVVRVRVPLGMHELAAGTHTLRLEVVSESPVPGKYLAGLMGVRIRAEGAPEVAQASSFSLIPSEPVPTQPGGVVTMQWQGAVAEGQSRTAFYLLAPRMEDAPDALVCAQADGSSAALALPQAARAWIERRQAAPPGLGVEAEDHLWGDAIAQAGLLPDGRYLLAADAPIGLDWDFPSGKLCVVTENETQVTLALDAQAAPTLDGETAPVQRTDRGQASLAVPAGRHVLEGVAPSPDSVAALGERLHGLLDTAQQTREGLAGAQQPAPTIAVPQIPTTGDADLQGAIVNIVPMRAADGSPLLAAAEDKTIHILATDGTELRRLSAEGAVRVLRWWDECGLLLAGCSDEKVIAFDAAGERKWEFISQMDPAVYEAAKQYWFKSAHPGIYGLHTGVFMGGKSQAFVGSACTLEILDEEGKLVKRMPVFWGPGAQFNLIDGPEESVNLLVQRWPNGTDALAIINSNTLSQGRGFEAVPPGYTHVGGWTALNRARTIYVDLDGDGAREVVSGINGVWNRVTVWDEAGKPLYNAQFGPGEKAPGGNLADLDVCDLTGDGQQEVVVASREGVLVALDSSLRKVWAKRMPSAPRVVRCLGAQGQQPVVIVGCEDGTVLVLDESGAIVARSRVSGRPAKIAVVATPAGPLAAIATLAGEVRFFSAPQ